MRCSMCCAQVSSVVAAEECPRPFVDLEHVTHFLTHPNCVLTVPITTRHTTQDVHREAQREAANIARRDDRGGRMGGGGGRDRGAVPPTLLCPACVVVVVIVVVVVVALVYVCVHVRVGGVCARNLLHPLHQVASALHAKSLKTCTHMHRRCCAHTGGFDRGPPMDRDRGVSLLRRDEMMQAPIRAGLGNRQTSEELSLRWVQLLCSTPVLNIQSPLHLLNRHHHAPVVPSHIRLVTHTYTPPHAMQAAVWTRQSNARRWWCGRTTCSSSSCWARSQPADRGVCA